MTSWDPNVTGPSGTSVNVRALALSGTTLYAGGSFSAVNNGSATRNNLAALDTITGTATSFDPNVAGGVQGFSVSALAVSGATVFAGGTFTTVNGGTTRNRLAAFDATSGAALAWDANVNLTVNALLVSGSTLYAGGQFSVVNGSVSRLHAAAFSTTTGVATSWNPSIGGSATIAGGGAVNALALSGSTVYIGGNFGLVNGSVARDNLAGVDATTGAAASFAPVVGGTVTTVGVAGSDVYAGGAFVSLGGARRQSLAAIDLSTGTLTGWDPMGQLGSNLSTFQPTVYALALSGSSLYVGGAFSLHLGSSFPSNLAAFDTASGNPTSFTASISGASSTVRALAVAGGTVYAGGTFTTANGSTARSNLASFDAASGAVTNWDPNVNGTVLALSVGGGTVYAGGAFTTVNGSTTRNRLAAFDATSATATAFDPNVSGTLGVNSDPSVSAVGVSGSTIYAGGVFSTVNGSLARAGLASFDAASGAATSWQPLSLDTRGVQFSAPVNDLALDGASVYVASGGGGFLAAAPSGDNGGFVIGGDMTAASDSSRHEGVAAFDATTGNVRTWNPQADIPSAVEAVGIGAPYVAIGMDPRGSINTLNSGAVLQGEFAAFTLTADPTSGSGHSISGHIWANGPGFPVESASISACPAPADTPCRLATSGVDGSYSLTNLPDHTSGGGAVDHSWTLTVSPPATAGLNVGTLGPVSVAGLDVTGQDVTLDIPTPLPSGVSVESPSHGIETTGIPTVNWHDPVTLHVAGCVGGSGTATLFHGPDGFSDSYTQTVPLAESPAGAFSATFDPVFPHHGTTLLSWTIQCGGTNLTGSFDIYIDPSGLVEDTHGHPIAAATVTLLRSDVAGGPFAAVPDGSSIMSPGNQKNPDTANQAGQFGWDVLPGFYEVRATASGCHAPGDPGQPAVFSPVLTIPPPVTDLVLTLECATTAPPPDSTAPTLSCAAADGLWHAANVSIACTASDGGSGLANAGDATFTLTTSIAAGEEDANALTGSHQVCDNAGNCATAGPVSGNMVDRKAPTVSCGAADGSWHADNVSIGCTGSDAGSGLANASDASFQLTTSVAAGDETANAATGSRNVCDTVGNCSTAGPVSGNKIDRKAPSLTLPAPITVTATSADGATVSFTVTASDGTDPTPAVVCVPASESTFAVGQTTVNCTATDHAGNQSHASFTITVNAQTGQPTAAQLIVALINKLRADLKLTALSDPLAARLQDVATQLVQQKPKVACRTMDLFIVGVKLLPSKYLTTAQKNDLVADANHIKAVIGC